MAEKSPTHYLETQGIGGTNKVKLEKGDRVHVGGFESGLGHFMFSSEVQRLPDGSEVLFRRIAGLPTHRRIRPVYNGRSSLDSPLHTPLALGGERHYLKVETA